MLGAVEAAADEDASVAIEHGQADAGAIGQGFVWGHGVSVIAAGRARDARKAASIAAAIV
jgi:hypothetical protein